MSKITSAIKNLLTLLFSLLLCDALFAQKNYLDYTFGDSGKVLTYLQRPTQYSYAVPKEIACQKDGKIIIVGTFDRDYYFRGDLSTAISGCFCLRYLLDGSPDTVFNNTINKYFTNITGNSIKIQKDGKILIGGSSSDSSLVILRFNANGIPDSSFNNIGYSKFNFNNIINDNRPGQGKLCIQNNGKIIIAGDYNQDFGASFFLIARADSNGWTDSTFGINGEDTINLPNMNVIEGGQILQINNIILQPDSKILLIADGIIWDDINIGYHQDIIAIGRTDSTGRNDLKFNNQKNRPEGYNCYGIYLKNGNILAYIGENEEFVQYGNDGTVDSSFGLKGLLKDTSLNYFYCGVILQQNDSSFYMCGATRSISGKNFSLVKCSINGKRDTSFNTTGILSTFISGKEDFTHAMVEQADGKILLAGVGDTSVALVRYLPTGIITGTLNFSKENPKLLVFPNPVHDWSRLEYTLENEENLSIKIYDLQGRMVRSVLENKDQVAGSYNQNINFSEVKAGAYIIRLTNGTGMQDVKIIKE